MNIDEEMKELREAINIESHIALQLNTLLCKCNVCNAIGNLYIILTIFKGWGGKREKSIDNKNWKKLDCWNLVLHIISFDDVIFS